VIRLDVSSKTTYSRRRPLHCLFLFDADIMVVDAVVCVLVLVLVCVCVCMFVCLFVCVCMCVVSELMFERKRVNAKNIDRHKVRKQAQERQRDRQNQINGQNKHIPKMLEKKKRETCIQEVRNKIL